MKSRCGVTVMELLVVMSIIGMLLALLLPAVMHARAAARRTQCANNLRNVGLAVLADAEAKGRFPGSGYFGEAGEYHNWVLAILPRLERGDMYRQWDFTRPASDPVNKKAPRVQIDVLVCPDDDSAVSGKGNLSYVVNGGFGWTIPEDCPATYRSRYSPIAGVQPIDLNGNGTISVVASVADGTPSDRDIFYRTGLFFIENWPLNWGNHRHHSLDSVLDGLSQTLMLSENVRAGYDAAKGTDWSSAGPLYNSFFLSGYVCKNASCSSANVDYLKANEHAGGPWSFEAINAALTESEGEAPWPSSYHLGGVNVVFADGRLHFLSENVDGLVYASLFSPQGTIVQGPLAQPLIADNAY